MHVIDNVAAPSLIGTALELAFERRYYNIIVWTINHVLQLHFGEQFVGGRLKSENSKKTELSYLWTLCGDIFIGGGLEIISKNLLINYCKPHGDIVALFPHPFLNPFFDFFPVRILFNNNMSPISLWYVVCRDHRGSRLLFNCVFSIIWGLGELFNHIDAKIAKVKLTEFVFLCVRENRGRTEHAGHSKIVFDVRNIFELFNRRWRGFWGCWGGFLGESVRINEPLGFDAFRGRFQYFLSIGTRLSTGGTIVRSFHAFAGLGAHCWCCNSPKSRLAKISDFWTSKISLRLNPPKVTVWTVKKLPNWAI